MIDTVITSFPQRWGSYFTSDLSGIHSRVRKQLERERDGVSSSYDLVLKIFNVCSRVFYENIKFADRQPMLNYIFSDSINFVVRFSSCSETRRKLTPGSDHKRIGRPSRALPACSDDPSSLPFP